MRLTLVTETYFPQLNGVSRTLGQLVRVLLDSGDEVQIIHPNYGDAPAEGASHELVRALRVPFYPEVRLPLPPFAKAKRALDRFGPDLVHIATEATLGLALLDHSLKRGIPAVSSFHTHFDQYTHHYGVGWSRGLIWRYLRWFHNRTLETYVPTRGSIAALSERGFERLVLWPRGVDGTLFRPDRPGRNRVRQALGFAPDDVVIGYVGRLAAEKNVAYLADALALAAAARPNVRVLIVGGGPARLAIEKRLGPSARFAGYRTGDDLADHYVATDLFAFASRTETFGNVIMEAMAAGLPVVALRAGGPGETVHEGASGLLLEPDDGPAVFSEALLHLVDDSGLRQQMSHSARADALSHTWDAVMSDLRERYLQIASACSAEPAVV